MDLVSLKAASAWDTIPAGLAASGDEMALDRFEELFNNYSLDAANFGELKSGAGSIVEAIGLKCQTFANADAGAIWYKTAFDISASEVRDIAFQPKQSVSIQSFLWITDGVSNPVIDGSLIISVYVNSGFFRVIYVDNLGATFYWTGSAWGGATNLDAASVDAVYRVLFKTDGTSWQVTIYDLTNDTMLIQTTPVAWAATKAPVGDIWATMGDSLSSNTAHFIYKYFITEYSFDSPVAIMGAVAVDTTIEQLPITESVEVGAAITWRYDIGAGFVTPGTGSLADLKTALIGTSPATLDLESTFTSDGEDGGSFDINGGVIAGTFDYPIEANVLEGIEYDDGNLTGTLKKYSVDTNPNDTKRKRILDVLDTRLKAINTGNGYKTDLGDNVFRWRVTEMNPFDPEEELPGVNYVDDDQRPEQSSHGPETVEHSMQVMLHVYATTEAELRSARADIVEAIGADVGFSTLAQDAQLIDDGSDTAHEQDKIWSTEMFLQIMYTTGRWDPYE